MNKRFTVNHKTSSIDVIDSIGGILQNMGLEIKEFDSDDEILEFEIVDNRNDKLKILGYAYKISELCFDTDDEEEIDNLIENYHVFKAEDRDLIRKAFYSYSGYSPYDMSQEMSRELLK